MHNKTDPPIKTYHKLNKNFINYVRKALIQISQIIFSVLHRLDTKGYSLPRAFIYWLNSDVLVSRNDRGGRSLK